MPRELTSGADSDYCTQQVRMHDRDRYLTALFAPERRRGDLLALFAFNTEVAKTAEMVSEPLLGQIRLQWWREAIDGIYGGTPRDHPVVRALFRAVERHQPPREPFDRLIDGRGFYLDDGPPETLDDLIAYATDTSAMLTALALHLLGVGQGDAAAHQAGLDVGIAWGLAGVLRAHPERVARCRVFLPNQFVTAVGEDGAARRVAGHAVEHLAAARAPKPSTETGLARVTAGGAGRAAFEPIAAAARPPRDNALRPIGAYPVGNARQILRTSLAFLCLPRFGSAGIYPRASRPDPRAPAPPWRTGVRACAACGREAGTDRN